MKTPYLLLAFGVAMLVKGEVERNTGKVWSRYGAVTCRAQEPKRFWRSVALDYLFGVLLIGFALFLSYGPV